MMLKYLNPETSYSSTERVLAVIGTGAVRRDQLLYLLSPCIQRARTDQVLHQLRQKGWLKTYYTSGNGEAIYTLSKRGLQQVGEDDAKPIRQRIGYHIAVNDVLVHCVDEFGVNGWEWHSRPEDSEVIPSARVQTGAGQWHIDVDDGTRLSRQLYDRCHRFKRLLSQSGRPERVLFVAQTREREQYLKNRVLGLSSKGVQFFVCRVDQVAEFLADAAVATS
ncbi:replication-relaxation family protein [Alicyclobacillus curvatus]|nr:replication-relaxation family protein [Alicyclobacillus curvatus]